MADAIVVPGGRYPPTGPLTMYAGDVAERRGAVVHRHSWTQRLTVPWGPAVEGWVRGQVEPLLAGVAGSPLLIGKSLGTAAAGVAADRTLPAVWLTPLLSEDWVVADLARASATFLLVGGSADRYWDSTTAHRLTPHLLEVNAADHNMYVPGPLTDTIAVLNRVVLAIEAFLDTIAWPT